MGMFSDPVHVTALTLVTYQKRIIIFSDQSAVSIMCVHKFALLLIANQE